MASRDSTPASFGTDLEKIVSRHKKRHAADLGDMIEELKGAIDGLQQDIEDAL